MDPTACWPLDARCKSLMPNLILHQQPLRTRAHSIVLAQMTWILVKILCRGPPPCHDHRIMLDVEFDPGLPY
jgi:hypothetical protein